jgi:hypothetical protein
MADSILQDLTAISLPFLTTDEIAIARSTDRLNKIAIADLLAKNPNLTGDGIVATSGGDGTLSVTATTGSGNVVLATSPSLTTPDLGTPSAGTLTNCTFPTLNQNTTGSAASLSISGQTGLLTVTGLASTNRVKTVRDAADTILELGGSYTPTGTWTSLTLVTPALGTPASGTLTNCTGLPQAGTVGLTTADSPQFTAINLGHASDTTITRVSAGVIAVEGTNVAMVGGNIGAATATTPARGDADTSVATTAFVMSAVAPIVTETGTTRTLSASDAGKWIRCTNASGCAITVNDSVFTAEDEVYIENAAAGVVSFVEGSGVTINRDTYTLATQYDVGGLKFISAATATLFGAITAP